MTHGLKVAAVGQGLDMSGGDTVAFGGNRPDGAGDAATSDLPAAQSGFIAPFRYIPYQA
jgi:hypothetical protein